MIVSDLTRICSTVSFICVAVLITVATIMITSQVLKYKLEKYKLKHQFGDDCNNCNKNCN